MILCVLKRILHKISQFSCNYWNPQFLLLLLLPSEWSFARGRPPLDELFQNVGSSGIQTGSSFARGRPLWMTVCKRLVPPDHHLQEAGPSFWQPRKEHEKSIFETLHNEIKCVLSVKESNFNEKNQTFHICLRSGPRWLTPPHTASLTVKYPFFWRVA